MLPTLPGYGSGGDAVGMFLGNGNGTLNPPLVVTGNYNSGLAVGDFYNDRIQSLALLYTTGPVDGNDTTYVETLRYSNGQLQVGPSTQVTQPVAEGPINIAGGDLNGDFIDDVFISGGGYYGGPYSEYMIGNGNGSFQAPQNAPYDKQGTTFSYPIIRDMNLDSRHDVSMAWLNVEDDNGGGDVLINDSADPELQSSGRQQPQRQHLRSQERSHVQRDLHLQRRGQCFQRNRQAHGTLDRWQEDRPEPGGPTERHHHAGNRARIPPRL